MNKFGIFSFLNSFLEFYKNNNANKGEENAEEKKEKKQTSTDFSSIVNNIFNANKEKKEAEPVPTIPLQKGMINVMNNPEKIVKRILEKNKK